MGETTMTEAKTEAAASAPTATKPDAAPLEAVLQATATRREGITKTAAAFLQIAPHQLCNLLRNVWKTTKGQPDLTDQEMFVGMSLIARYELDPIAREVYVTRDKQGRLMTILGIDAWVKILDRTDHYDGFEQELFPDDKGEEIEWVETTIHSKTRSKPVKYRAFMSEYRRLAGYMLDKIPAHMLRLFSLRHAARLFTPIGGSVVTEEEAHWMQLAAQAGSADAPSHDQLAKQLSPTPPAAPEESPAPDEPTAPTEDAPDPPRNPPTPEELLLEDLRCALPGLATIKGVADLHDESLKTPKLSAAAKATITQMCEDRADEIRDGRGQRSNT